MACNYESLEEEILDMIFADEDDEEQFNGFTRAEAEEIEREFEEDDSDFEDLLADEDSAPGDVTLNNIAWSNDDDSEVEVPAFREQVGPSVQLPRTAALDYLKLLFTADLITTIVNNTNNYATETILDSEDMRENWLPTNAEEIMAFLGVVIFMGIVKLLKVSMYFSADPRIHQVAVASVFSRNRFFQLLKYLHVSSPTAVPAREHPDYKLYRVKPLIDTLSRTFQEMYNPHREQSIDEAMVKYKGRIKFLQYMPMKPCKRGIKIWCRCDPHNGYLSQFEIYTGKDDAHENQASAREGRTQTPRVLLLILLVV